MPSPEALFSPFLRGVSVPHQYYEEFSDLLEEQARSQKPCPTDAESSGLVSADLVKTLRRYKNVAVAMAFEPEIAPLPNDTRSEKERKEADRLRYLPPAHLVLKPSDVENVINGLHRRAVALIVSTALETDDTVISSLKEQETRKISLAYALYRACNASEYDPVLISAEYATKGRHTDSLTK